MKAVVQRVGALRKPATVFPLTQPTDQVQPKTVRRQTRRRGCELALASSSQNNKN